MISKKQNIILLIIFIPQAIISAAIFSVSREYFDVLSVIVYSLLTLSLILIFLNLTMLILSLMYVSIYKDDITFDKSVRKNYILKFFFWKELNK